MKACKTLNFEMHRSQDQENEPIVGSIYDGEVLNIINAGCIVKLKGFIKKYEGFVYKHQFNEELQVGFRVRIKIIAKKGDFISLSMEGVSQPSNDEIQQQNKNNLKRNFVIRLSSPERNLSKVFNDAGEFFNIKITNTEPLFLRELKTKYGLSSEPTRKLYNTFLDRMAIEKNNPQTNTSDADPLPVHYLNDLLGQFSGNCFSKPPKAIIPQIKKSVEEQLTTLPIYARKNDFIKAIVSNQILIVVGETGSGKN
jgi:predicted RNA-binding protein with RPS1 domain